MSANIIVTIRNVRTSLMHKKILPQGKAGVLSGAELYVIKPLPYRFLPISVSVIMPAASITDKTTVTMNVVW